MSRSFESLSRSRSRSLSRTTTLRGLPADELFLSSLDFILEFLREEEGCAVESESDRPKSTGTADSRRLDSLLDLPVLGLSFVGLNVGLNVGLGGTERA